MLSFNKDVAGACVDIEAIRQISNREIQTKEISHIVEPIVLLSCIMLEVGLMLEVENSHVVMNNEIIMMVIQHVSSWKILMDRLLKGIVLHTKSSRNKKGKKEEL